MNRISTVPGEDRIYHLLPVTVTFHKSTATNRLQLMPAALSPRPHSGSDLIVNQHHVIKRYRNTVLTVELKRNRI